MIRVSRRSMIFASLARLPWQVAVQSAAETPADGMVILSDAELRLLAALCEVWFPAGVFPIDGIEAGVPEAVDGVLVGYHAARPARASYVLRTSVGHRCPLGTSLHRPRHR